jgi:multisubunit Na+/H+ antiporter MnhG subunit
LSKNKNALPTGHVLVPAAAIGSLSILLGAGLALFGALGRFNLTVARMVTQGKTVVFPKVLPTAAVWLVAVVLAFALSFAILSVPGTWRRVVLWITALVLVAGWAPVLVLAARAPDIGAPFIAVLWSGVCALVYAQGHRMQADGISPKGKNAPR